MSEKIWKKNKLLEARYCISHVELSFVWFRCLQAPTLRRMSEKQSFINQSPFFGNWSKKMKKLLSLCLERDIVACDSYLGKQGEQADRIFFIIKWVSQNHQVSITEVSRKKTPKSVFWKGTSQNNNRSNHSCLSISVVFPEENHGPWKQIFLL